MGSGLIRLTGDQWRAFDIIMRGDDTFVTGGAGTGKSVLIKEVIKGLEIYGKSVVVCAPTGIAAVAIGGTTIHKAFGFRKGPSITEKTHKLTEHTPKLIRMADVILIDEVSMCRMDMMDAICASVLKAREETGRHIQLVVVGDFCQLPPVIVEGSGEKELMNEYYGTDVGHAFAFQAPGWRKMNFTCVEMREVVRQQDEDFVRALNRLRLGDSSAIRYFNTFASFDDDPDAMKLYAYNEDVDRLNEEALAKLPGEMFTFPSCYEGFPADMIYNAPTVSLKVGSKVIVTTNQATLLTESYGNDKDLYNGSIGIVTDAKVYPDDPVGDYVIVSSGGRYYCISRKTENIYTHRIDVKGNIRREIAGIVSYMPVKPGYVMTIHRSQGQTFESVVLDPSCRNSGQLYVAISRLRSISGLHLTRRISVKDLCLAPIVKEFYSHLGDSNYIPSWEKNVSEPRSSVRRRDNVLQFHVMKASEVPIRSVPEPEDATEIEETPLVRKVSSLSKEPVTAHTVEVQKASSVPDTVPVEAPLTVEHENAGAVEEISVTKTVALKKPSRSAAKDKNIAGEQSDVKKTRGRPARYANSSKVCRIPVELVDEVRLMLQIVCPKGGMNMKELERFKAALRELCQME